MGESLSCEPCGACCLRAFDALDLEADDPFIVHRPDLVTPAWGRLQLQKSGDSCPLLTGDGSEEKPYRCSDYGHRPRTCRDLAVGSVACYQARGLCDIDDDGSMQPPGAAGG